ncbi:MAG: hypothetical protein Q4C87_00965 [Actinomycetaceae bacterium]|nr:hypothetical protein [Actinomycetaceae bacterium]
MVEETLKACAKKYGKAQEILRSAADNAAYAATLQYLLTCDKNEREHLPFDAKATVVHCGPLLPAEALLPIRFTLMQLSWSLSVSVQILPLLARIGAYSRLEAILQYTASHFNSKRPSIPFFATELLDIVGAYSYVPGLAIDALKSSDKYIYEDGEFIVEFHMSDSPYRVKPISYSPHDENTLPSFDTVDKDTYRDIITALEHAYTLISSTFIPFAKNYRGSEGRKIVSKWLTPIHGRYDAETVTMACHLLIHEGPGGLWPFTKLLAPLALDDEHTERALHLLAYTPFMHMYNPTTKVLSEWLTNCPGEYAPRVEKAAHIYSFLGLTTPLQKLTISCLLSKEPNIRAIGLRLTKDPFFTNDPLFFTTQGK